MSGARTPGFSAIACSYLVRPRAHALASFANTASSGGSSRSATRGSGAGHVQGDPVEVAVALGKAGEHRRAGPRSRRRARPRRSALLDALDAVDLEHADRACAGACPFSTRGRSQRRKASVIRPAAMPSQVSSA